MSTRAQRRASKQNARKSTGPRTSEGKAASSRNAIRHNLAGTTFVLLPGEDRDAFDRLLGEYVWQWKPCGSHEMFLVETMVHARWRLNRIARMEAQCYDTLLHMPFAEDETDEAALIIADRMMPAPNMLDKLRRYAQDAERSYHRAVREIRAYRKEQREQPRVVEDREPRADPKPAPRPVRAKAATASRATASADFRNEPADRLCEPPAHFPLPDWAGGTAPQRREQR